MNEPYCFFKGLGDDAPMIEANSLAELKHRVLRQSIKDAAHELLDYTSTAAIKIDLGDGMVCVAGKKEDCLKLLNSGPMTPYTGTD